MKFRWSNEIKMAVEFESNQLKTFADDCLNALIEFRNKTGKRFHDGEMHRSAIYYPHAFLHLETAPGYWNHLGENKEGVWVPHHFAVENRTHYEGDPVHEPTDSQICRANAEKWWRWAIDTLNWKHQIDGFLGDVKEAVQSVLEEEDKGHA